MREYSVTIFMILINVVYTDSKCLVIFHITQTKDTMIIAQTRVQKELSSSPNSRMGRTTRVRTSATEIFDQTAQLFSRRFSTEHESIP